MESAQDRHTGRIVEAEELWLMETVDKERYMCRGCGIKVIPASYQPHNVVRPYFAARAEEHRLDCDVDGVAKLVKKARRGRIGDQLDGFPNSFPSKLVLLDERPVVDAGLGANAPQTATSGRRSDGATADEAPAKGRTRTANTIRPICRAFINFPYDRDRPLAVPGVDASMYKFAFKKLQWNALIRYPDRRIMYASMRWNKPIKSDENLEILLDAGERDANKRISHGYRVQLLWSDWSKAKRTYVGNEIEAARTEAIKAKDEGRSQEKAFLFFIGEQDLEDPSLFYVKDHRLLCCLVDEIIYPDLLK